MPEEALATGGRGGACADRTRRPGAPQTSSRKTISVESDFLGPNLMILV
jgi:hypothetical protein